MSRAQKIAEELRKEISKIIIEDLNDPRLGFITITEVKLSDDLMTAKVFYSVLGQDQDYARTKKALASALKFIRRMVGERMRLRFVPEIIFKEDRSSEYGLKIDKILREIKEL